MMTPGSRHTAAKSTQLLLLARRVNFLVKLKKYMTETNKNSYYMRRYVINYGLHVSVKVEDLYKRRKVVVIELEINFEELYRLLHLPALVELLIL